MADRDTTRHATGDATAADGVGHGPRGVGREGVDGARERLGRQLALLRRAAGQSQQALAARVGYSRSTIANIEVGRQNAPRALWQTCDDVLHGEGTLLASHDDLQARISTHYRTVAALQASARSEPGNAPTPTLPTPPGSTLVGADRRHPARRCPGQVDLVAVAQLREQVHRLADAYDQTPSTSLTATAAACQATATAFGQAAADGRVRRALRTVQAEIATLLGQLVWDASQRRDHTTAGRYFRAAVDLSRSVGDPAAEAHATLRTGYLALYGTRRPRLGLHFASRAAEVAVGTSPTITGYALLHVAEAHAMLGDQRACEQALDRAQEQLAVHDDLDPGGDFSSPLEFARMAGSCYLSLGRPAKAETHLTTAAHSIRRHHKMSALVLANLALASVRQRRVDHAVATLHQAIDALTTTRGGGGLAVAVTVARALRHHQDTAEVRTARDRLLDLLTPTTSPGGSRR